MGYGNPRTEEEGYPPSCLRKESCRACPAQHYCRRQPLYHGILHEDSLPISRLVCALVQVSARQECKFRPGRRQAMLFSQFAEVQYRLRLACGFPPRYDFHLALSQLFPKRWHDIIPLWDRCRYEHTTERTCVQVTWTTTRQMLSLLLEERHAVLC